MPSIRVLPMVALLALAAVRAPAQEAVGVRPYELDWAGRTREAVAPLVDFEDLAGWRVVPRNSVATFTRTREQQVWDRYVGKLIYRGTGAGPEVRIVPPAPIAIKAPFDAITLWCYGNNWGYASDPTTPQVSISALFRDSAGQEFSVWLWQVDWTEWNLLHRRLTPEQLARCRNGAQFVGLLIGGGRQKEDRAIYLDNLSVYKETFNPLTFEPRPRRGVAMFKGQSTGTNTGPGKLPFPTREQTILPPVTDRRAAASAAAIPGGARFTCTDATGVITYTVRPSTGRWDDIESTWSPRAGAQPVRIRPCVGGGAWLKTPAGPAMPTSGKLVASRFAGGVLQSTWRLAAGGASADVTYRFRVWGKSLVMDVESPGGSVAEVRYGRATGCRNARVVTHPFYPADGGRPGTLVFDTPTRPLFLAGNTDWYRTNASTMWATTGADGQYNGGTRYVPLTNGATVDCYERFFLTLSPLMEETLPTIDNPVSPWKRVTGTRVWRAHGAGNREADKKYWANVQRHGITRVIVTDHETMWRDGGESFTFRTRTAPGKGGEQGARDYSRFMQDKLGFVYGPYNNFTDFAPVNEYWSTDLIARDPQDQLQHAWMRCYAPKPARAVEYCARLSPINQKKYGFSTAYCDVHTAVAPWHRVDYDPRVPGAGTLSAVFYSYGEIMLHQKRAWNGPVYSEGNHHAFYCGLTDGNYGQDQAYRPAENPWLVDFDLRRMHDLGCNFGMGAPDMFYANVPQPQSTQAERDAWLDRFLAATVAFGHPGFLVLDGGMGPAARSYYMLQQLHSRYCLAHATEIRYADGAGNALTSSQAVAGGAYRRSQVATRYSDGTITASNGSKTERMRLKVFGRTIDLPPNGYLGWSGDGSVEVFSGDLAGSRADYSVSPDYLYMDGRGRYARFARAAGSGASACRRLPGGKWELIPFSGEPCGFAVPAGSAVAIDQDRKVLGKAEVRISRGLVHVIPVPGAFSYILSGPARPATGPNSSRVQVVPGEAVPITGGQVVKIPADAKPGSRVWQRLPAGWLDFVVAQAMEMEVTLAGTRLRVQVRSNLPRPATVQVEARGAVGSVPVAPGQSGIAWIDLGAPTTETAEAVMVTARAGAATSSVEIGLRASSGYHKLADLPTQWVGGVGLRGQPRLVGFGDSGAHVTAGPGVSGEVSRDAINMHPAWLNGRVGYAYARFGPMQLPNEPCALRAWVGKLDGSDPGDGILYRVVVIGPDGKETVAGEHTVREHAWETIAADLSHWAGHTVQLLLVADPGPANDSGGDWATWSGPRIETNVPTLVWSLPSDPARYRRAPAPFPVGDLTLEDLRHAVSGRLLFSGKGLNSSSMPSTADLNGVLLGNLPDAGGDEAAGRFAEDVALALTPAAIAGLRTCNTLTIQNPRRDFFSIRRPWLELTLADGRRVSSDIADVTFTQPGEWAYAEGIRVPFGEDIQFLVWFRLH